MIVEIFCAGHCVLYIASTFMRVVLYKYLRKKPLGLQSALDHLIIDMVKYQMFNYTLFMIFLSGGLLHGQIPYLPSKIFVWILIQSGVYLLGLYQFFIIVKAIIIFRGIGIEFLEGVSDDKLVMISRVFASVYISVRAIGDYFLTTERDAPMIAFLTGKETETNSRSGPMHLLVILILFVSNFTLLIKTFRISQEHQQRKLFGLISGGLFVSVLVMAGVIFFIPVEKFGLLVLFSFIQSMINHSFALYYILSLPELKEYFIRCIKDFVQIKIVNVVLSSLRFFIECWIDMFLLLICIGPKYPKIQPSNSNPNIVQTV